MVKPIHYKEMWNYFLLGNPLSESLAVRKFDLLHARYFYFLVYFARLLGHKIVKFKRNKQIFYMIEDKTINRNISISGDKTMKSGKEKTHNFECIMPGCVAVYSSSPGMCGHQKRKHGQGSKRDVNWRWTTKPVTFKNKNALAAQAKKGIRSPTATAEMPRTKRPYTRRQQVVPKPTLLVLSPDSKFIEINAVIRVPIEIGQPEILQQQQQS